MLFTTGMMVLALACTHLFASRLTFLDVIPRSRWLSSAVRRGRILLSTHLDRGGAHSSPVTLRSNEGLTIAVNSNC